MMRKLLQTTKPNISSHSLTSSYGASSASSSLFRRTSAAAHGNALRATTNAPSAMTAAFQQRTILINPYGTSISEIAQNNKDMLQPSSLDTSASPNPSAAREISLRGRMLRSRIKGNKLGFFVLRQGANDTIQVVVANEGDEQTKAALDLAKTITPESVIDIKGRLVKAHKPVTGTSCSDFEIIATQISIVTMAESPLPFTLNDANTKLDTRLDHRIMDLRTPTTNAVLRLTSKVCQYFREYLTNPQQDFFEIHSPKMIASPSEGGSAIFQLEYFGQPAYLAQSPQLFKQMALMGDCERVFEIGPVFRAEKSLTHRHLTEFTGLDAEMIIKESHIEVLHVLEGTMHAILHRLQTECGDLISSVVGKKDDITILMSAEKMKELGVGEDNYSLSSYNPISSSSSSSAVEVPRPSRDAYGARVGAIDSPVPILRLPFDGAVQLLIDNKVIDATVDDFNLQQEKQLGEVIKQRYGVDVYIIDLFPVSARPFYTMIDASSSSEKGAAADANVPTSPTAKTLSYDMYLRGEEICSGAQRIHDPALLKKRAAECGVTTELIKDYIDSFRYGAFPHGGFGLGMERIVLFFLGLADVRQVSMFPRDPKRITP